MVTASPPAKGREVADWFWKAAVEYYASGRQAALTGLGLIAGNTFHHAVEFFLKGELAKDEPYTDFKHKYGHKLIKAWAVVKEKFPAQDLHVFDNFLTNLDRFEDIRYPDVLIQFGAFISVGFGPPPTQGGANAAAVPEYHLNVREVDDLFARLFPLFSMNPPFYMPMDSAALEAIKQNNKAASDEWFR